MPSHLTPKQTEFARQYLLDMNGTQAAIRAGYSAKTAEAQASRLLSNVKVAETIQTAMNKRAERTEITTDRVLREYARVAFADIRSVVTVKDGSVIVADTDQLTDDEAAAISEISETTSATGGSIKVKLHSKMSALQDIAKHLGMFPDRRELTGRGGGPIEVEHADADLKDAIRKAGPEDRQALAAVLLATEDDVQS